MNICTGADKSQETGPHERLSLRFPWRAASQVLLDLPQTLHPSLDSMPSISGSMIILPREMSPGPGIRKPSLQPVWKKTDKRTAFCREPVGLIPPKPSCQDFFLTAQLTGLFLGHSSGNLNSKSSHRLINAGSAGPVHVWTCQDNRERHFSLKSLKIISKKIFFEQGDKFSCRRNMLTSYIQTIKTPCSFIRSWACWNRKMHSIIASTLESSALLSASTRRPRLDAWLSLLFLVRGHSPEAASALFGCPTP